MFEFDEHFDELEAMESGLELLQDQVGDMLPAWAYVGNDVWKLSFDVESSAISQEWHLETEDVA